MRLVYHQLSLAAVIFNSFLVKLDQSAHPYFAEITDLRVSAHCLIERDGHIVQFVSFLERAWHAGVSHWRGESDCNDFSIGIELEGTDETEYCDVQYAQLKCLLDCLRQQYSSLELDALCGHSEIAPGRKTDPGPYFDWQRLSDPDA